MEVMGGGAPMVRDVEVEWVRYGEDEGRDLNLRVYVAEALQAQPRAVAVFYHGGGWHAGRREQFATHAEHLARLGMVGILVEYRRRGPVLATRDAVESMQFIHGHLDRWNGDSERIVAIGGSAGGHLALESRMFGSRREWAGPDTFILFNPVTNTSESFPGGFGFHKFVDESEARSHSPYHQLSDGASLRVLVMHGTADETVHHGNSVEFCEAIEYQGGEATVVLYPGASHGFFNERSTGKQYHLRTLSQMEHALRSWKFIS
ncbi:alpha/beta hydrolase [Ruania rhizosphaerae]|uniref:alpha/beta hydrolase n=1 Tax=Ruania rhizosphaerae TaxID=1840413 RepID=UPI001356C447|nr:alpha/beta hydrolase [Ruania rhizosphaerae]